MLLTNVLPVMFSQFCEQIYMSSCNTLHENDAETDRKTECFTDYQGYETVHNTAS